MRTLIFLFALLPAINLFTITDQVVKSETVKKTISKGTLEIEKENQELVYKHHLDPYTLLIPAFVVDGDLSSEMVSDTVYLQEGSDSPLEIQQAFLLEIVGHPKAEITIEQAFCTSLTISDEGPSITLDNWKHYKSDWAKLKKVEGKFKTLTYQDEDRSKFPEVALNTFKEYVKKEYGARWYDVIKDNRSVADNGSYPAYVNITAHYFRIRITPQNGKKMERIVAIKLAQGC